MGDTELMSLHAIQMHNASNRKEKKTAYSVVHYLSNKHMTNIVLDRSQDAAGLVTQVVSIPTEHEFWRVVGEWKRYSACGLVATR